MRAEEPSIILLALLHKSSKREVKWKMQEREFHYLLCHFY